MKTFAAIAVLAAVASAQLDNIPSCALNCFITPLNADGCNGLLDFACHCKKSDSLISTVTPCVQKACSADDQAKVIKGVQDTCSSAGVPISVSTPAGSESSAAPASSAPAETSAAPAQSSAGGYPASSAPASPTPSGGAPASTPAGTGSQPTPTPSSNGTLPTNPTPSQFSGLAAAVTQAPIVLGAAALAMLAL